MWAIDSNGLLTIVKFKCLENFENAHIARKWQLKYVPNECNCAFQHKQSHNLSIVQLQSHRYFHFNSIGRYFTRNSSNINAEQHPKQVGRKKKSLVFTQRFCRMSNNPEHMHLSQHKNNNRYINQYTVITNLCCAIRFDLFQPFMSTWCYNMLVAEWTEIHP